MPSLNWIGKDKIVNHDKDVPFRLLKKNKKYIIEFYIAIFSMIATASMAILTGWLAWETRGLKKIDIGPNISISDVNLQLIDETGTPRKENSWRDGELLEKGAITINTNKAILAVEFFNTGKSMGYIKLSNLNEIEKKLGIIFKDDNRKLIEDYYLVPADGKTGMLYGVNIYKWLAEQQSVSLIYKINVYNQDLKFFGNIKFLVECRTDGGQAYCEPKGAK